MGRIIFITGTDTGIGKTAVTALLLAHAQSEKINVRALKPFSTAGHGDEALLSALQSSAVPINFFHYSEPLAPWSAARLRQQVVRLDEVVSRIAPHRDGSELLLIEGAGGLLTPLGERFTAAEIMAALAAEPLVVASNRLGVINHTRLTTEALAARSLGRIKVALVEHAAADSSRKTNLSDLKELLPNVKITAIPYLANYMADAQFIRRAATQLKPVLEELLA